MARRGRAVLVLVLVLMIVDMAGSGVAHWSQFPEVQVAK